MATMKSLRDSYNVTSALVELWLLYLATMNYASTHTHTYTHTWRIHTHTYTHTWRIHTHTHTRGAYTRTHTWSLKQPFVASHSSCSILPFKIQDGLQSESSVGLHHFQWSHYLLQRFSREKRERLLSKTNLLISMTEFDLFKKKRKVYYLKAFVRKRNIINNN